MWHGTALEWAQMAAALVGLVVQAGVWVDAWLDYRMVWRMAAATTVHHIVAVGTMRGETLRLVLSLTFFGVGCAAVALPPPPGELAPHAVMKLYALLVGSLTVTVAAVTSRQDRKAILRLR